jgi:dTDP-4-dehydrorhamnose 3,5-epimerase-like enzyme
MELKKIEIKKLIIHKDERGYLFEGLKNNDHLFDGKFGQCLISVVNPEIIKGLHKHKIQTDYTLCVKGKVLYVVGDEEKFEQFILDGDDPLLIKVPPGYWHGYKAMNDEALLVHIMDTIFDPNDTEAVDPYHFGDFWTIKDE